MPSTCSTLDEGGDAGPSTLLARNRRQQDTTYGTFSEARPNVKRKDEDDTDPEGLEKEWCGLTTAQMLRPSLSLANEGSVARDHLASERTFMAYIRTSLQISMFGVVLFQLLSLSPQSHDRRERPSPINPSMLNTLARPLAVFVIVVGLAVLLIGDIRYFSVQVNLVSGYFSPARVTTLLIASALSKLHDNNNTMQRP